MADEPSFLHRWSRRKHEAARATPAPPAAAVAPAPAVAAAAPAPVEPPPLPPVESLTLESDFTPFLSAKVEETVKRAAMRKLFSDPHFNVMDGLDIYIGDYSKPDPMPEGFLDKLAGVYNTLEEKAAEPALPQTEVAAAEGAATETPATPAEPPVNDDQETDERQG